MLEEKDGMEWRLRRAEGVAGGPCAPTDLVCVTISTLNALELVAVRKSIFSWLRPALVK